MGFKLKLLYRASIKTSKSSNNITKNLCHPFLIKISDCIKSLYSNLLLSVLCVFQGHLPSGPEFDCKIKLEKFKPKTTITVSKESTGT